MKVTVTRDAADFAERTRELFTRRPIEHNVLATVLATLEPTDCAEPPVFAWVEAARAARSRGLCCARRLGACWLPA